MHTEAAFFSFLLALAEARFGQEQAVAGNISALSDFGQPGQAATLAGASPGVLLAGANPCDKLTLADQIVTSLGNDAAVIDAAKSLVAAEKNFNPFAVSIPSICGDPALPATPELRGITPLVDPDVGGSDVANADSEASLANPFDADGLSVAQVMINSGFTNLTAVDAGGAAVNLDGADGEAPNAGAERGQREGDEAVATTVACGAAPQQTAVDQKQEQDDNRQNENNQNNNQQNENGNQTEDDGAAADGVTQSSIQGLDFGLCVPTMAFLPGLGGRPDTEFTFIPQDPLVAEGQQEALNPNIITNRICDQLTNVCEANDAAKAACLDAKAQISAVGTRDLSTAQLWNEILGFDQADASSPNAP